MSSLKNTIHELALSFADSVLEALRQSSLQDMFEDSHTANARQQTATTEPVRKKQAVYTTEEIAVYASRVVEILKRGETKDAEVIRAELGIGKRAWNKVQDALIDGNMVKVKPVEESVVVTEAIEVVAEPVPSQVISQSPIHALSILTRNGT